MKIVVSVVCKKDAIIAKALEVMNRHLRQRNCVKISDITYMDANVTQASSLFPMPQGAAS